MAATLDNVLQAINDQTTELRYVLLADRTVPATDGVVLTKSDTTVFPKTRALYVGGTGDVTVRMASGRYLLISTVPAGGLLPISVDMLFSTGTTATTVVALY